MLLMNRDKINLIRLPIWLQNLRPDPNLAVLNTSAIIWLSKMKPVLMNNLKRGTEASGLATNPCL